MMSAENKISLLLDLTGSKCNTWPLCEIMHNNDVIFCEEIKNNVILEFTLTYLETNTLSISLKNKKFGENRIWDTKTDDDNNIIEDKNIVINDIQFENISINKQKLETLKLIKQDGNEISTCGHIGFNGSITLKFTTPIYNWLIDTNAYKSIIPIKNISYFSNYTALNDYSKQEKLISEIHEIISNIST